MTKKLIDMLDALPILWLRGINISYTLFRHYCNTGRAPKGARKVGRSWLFTEDGLAIWKPIPRKRGKKPKDRCK